MLLPLNKHWGVDVGGTTAVIGYLSGDEFITEEIIPSKQSSHQSETSLFSYISKIILSADPAPATLGVGIAGLVDRTNGILITSPNLRGYENTAIRDIFRNSLNCPVIVDNDANSFAACIIASGEIPADGLRLMVTVGTGIGGAIILNGRIVYGTGYAGEFGHAAIMAEGKFCKCGSRGCWELYASKDALLEYYGNKVGHNPDISTAKICSLADSGNADAVSAFEEIGYWMGIGLANLAACFSPDSIARGGGLAGAFRHLAASAESEYVKRTQIPWNVTPVKRTDSTGAEGAAIIGSGAFN